MSALLGQHIKANNLGQGFGAKTEFKLTSNPAEVCAADIAFVRRERIPETGLPKNFRQTATDLAVEVLSPGDTLEEVEEMVEDWLAAGTRAVRIVSPKRRSVTVYRSMTDLTRLSEADELGGGTAGTGFRCKVSEIFV